MSIFMRRMKMKVHFIFKERNKEKESKKQVVGSKRDEDKKKKSSHNDAQVILKNIISFHLCFHSFPNSKGRKDSQSGKNELTEAQTIKAWSLPCNTYGTSSIRTTTLLFMSHKIYWLWCSHLVTYDEVNLNEPT